MIDLRKTILLVEEDRSIRDLESRLLKKDYVIEECNSIEGAKERLFLGKDFNYQSIEVNAVLVGYSYNASVNMEKFASEVKKTYPPMFVGYIGGPVNNDHSSYLNKNKIWVFPKPFEVVEIKKRLDEKLKMEK